MKNAAQVMEGLRRHKQRIEQQHAQGLPMDGVMNDLFMFLSVVSDDATAAEIKAQPEFAGWCEFFARHWVVYFSKKEIEQSRRIVSGEQDYALALSDKEYLMNYDPEAAKLITAYAPTRQTLDYVMVGCGAFPETLIRTYLLAHHYAHIIGIDSCATSIKLATELCAKHAMRGSDKGITFVEAEGDAYDYSSAGVVFIANILQNKRNTAIRAAKTMPDDAVIILRNPMRLGRLIHEDAFEGGAIEGLETKELIEIGTKSSIYALMRNK